MDGLSISGIIAIIAVIKQIALSFGNSANEWLVIEVYIQSKSETMDVLVGLVFYLLVNRREENPSPSDCQLYLRESFSQNQ